MQRMIRQFAAEYTSKTSSTQDSNSPNSTKNQSLLKASPVASSSAGATAQNPVLSKLLMADQDSPLDLTVRKSQLDPSEQDGVLDLSTKKSPCAGSASLSHSPGCSTVPGNGEDTAEAKAINCLGQPKSPLEKFMVRLCTYHQKHFVRVLNDICSEVQTGCGGQQLPGPENMDLSACSSSCSQYRAENQELGTPESKLPSCLDPEQSGPHGSLRLLCHALKQAVDLKSTDRRENCSPMVRRDFPELPNVRTSSANPRDSPTQGYLTASNSHHSAKALEGQISGSEQETGIRKSEEDREQPQSRALLGGYITAKPSHVNASEDSLECRGGLQKNPFKVFPEETREASFTTSSPRRADKENSFQCSSKSLPHQDPEINDQEMKQKAENHHQALGKCKGSFHVHPVDKTHVENAKDSWLPTTPMPVVHHKTANGHTRAKNISTSSKSTRKSKRSSGLRINDYDNQCDVVYISQPITECHFESKRVVSSRKTARKSTRGYYYNGECCELPTVRTLAKISLVQESGSLLAPQLEAVTSLSQGVTLPGGSCLATAQAESSPGEKRACIVDHPQEDSVSKKSQGTAEQGLAEIIPSQASFLEQSDVSSVEAFTNDLSLLLCPVSHAKEGSLSVSSVQATAPSPPPQRNEGERQDMANTNVALQADNDKDSCKNSKLNEDSSSVSNSVLLPVPEAANTEVNSLCLDNESDSKPTVLIDPEPPVCRHLLPSEEPEAKMDLMPPLEDPASVVNLAASADPPPLSPINPVQPQAELPALVCLDPSVAFPAEFPSVATSRAASPVVVPVSVVPEPPVLEPSEAPSVRATVAEASKEGSELPQLPRNADTAELPVNLQCANAYGNTDAESDVDSSNGLQDSMTGKHEPMLPIADTDDNQGGGNVKEIREKSKAGEGEEMDSSPPSVPRIPEGSHRVDVSSKMYLDKKRKREKKPQVASDRCLRSQQSLLPAEDSTEEPCSSTSVQLPQLQIKLSKSPGAKRFKREVHLDGAVSVCVPSDRFHETQLNHTGNTPEQPMDEGNDITMRQTYKKLVATETAIEDSQDGEGNSNKPGAMLEICLEASSDKRSVHVPEEASDKDERQTDLSSGSPEDTDSAMNVTEVPCTLYEASCPPCPGSKNESREGPLERPVKYKKPALQFYNLRHSPDPASVATAYKSTPGKEITQGHSHMIDPQSTGNEGHLGFHSMEVLSDKPKFVEWCAEEENQELITSFDAQYMKIQKGWIQLEKEVQPAPKVKNKSDKLKEIWKSKKRTRKFKGSADVQKLSPVQMLFMKPFDMSDICKWFMETTETKSLVIVKKLNTRLPGDLPPTKLPLQKGCSSGAYPSSLQAERLKKHLKKFAALTPAKNTIRTQKLWAKLRESPEETDLEQVGSQQQTSPSEGSMELGVEAKNAQPPPSIPVQTSSRILRKYSNLRGKLHGLRRMVKQEKNECVVKHASLESKPSSKSLCSKPPVPAKLAQSVRAVPLPTKSKLAGKGGKGRKGKDGPQEDVSYKGNLQQSRKKIPNESSGRLQGQQSSSSKEKVPLKKASKTKHVGTTTTKKQTAAERSNNKHASQSEKAKKLANSQLGKRKSPTTQKGKASTNQKSTPPSKPEGSAKPIKQKAVQDSPSRSLKATPKKATSGKALTRSGKRIQESNKGQGKKKLRAKEDSSPIKRRRLDTK